MQIHGTQTDVQGMKAEITGMQTHLRNIDARLDRIENIVGRNYTLTEEFYVSQKETNVEFQAEFRIIHGTLDMHARQISHTTSILKDYRIS